ncbi:MAG TPA: roadblock/LC7 domain-containing protein [Gemmatimonadales bacterium]
MSTFDFALEGLTRVPGVESAMVVSAEDGLVVGEASMGGVDTAAVAALSASLHARIGEMAAAAGRQPPLVAHLEASQGGLLIVPAGEGLLLVAVAHSDANLGLLRLALRAASERLA